MKSETAGACPQDDSPITCIVSSTSACAVSTASSTRAGWMRPSAMSAVSALRALGIEDQPVIGLAKRLEEVFIPGHSAPQNIPKVSSSLKLLQALRDESHRFAVTFHRQVRKKRTLHSVLEDIEGVGPVRRKQLLRHFGSMKRLREASLEKVKAVDGVGPKLAEQIVRALE